MGRKEGETHREFKARMIDSSQKVFVVLSGIMLLYG